MFSRDTHAHLLLRTRCNCMSSCDTVYAPCCARPRFTNISGRCKSELHHFVNGFFTHHLRSSVHSQRNALLSRCRRECARRRKQPTRVTHPWVRVGTPPFGAPLLTPPDSRDVRVDFASAETTRIIYTSQARSHGTNRALDDIDPSYA